MLKPLIREPVFAYAEFVIVDSIEAGTKVTISALAGVKETEGKQIGGPVTATGGSAIVEVPQLKSQATLIATAEKGSESSESAPVSVQSLPDPLPFPITCSTLYAGSNCIDTWGMVPGSEVTITSANDILNDAYGPYIAVDGSVLVGLKRPLTTADSVSLFATMGGRNSATTLGITPVMPHGSGAYSEKLPPPVLVQPLLECQQVAGLEGMMPGGRFWVYADNNIRFDHCTYDPSFSVLLSDILHEHQSVTAKQAFEVLNLKSDLSDPVPVGSAKNLTAPSILEPVYEGEQGIVILQLLHSVKVEIADAVSGKTIGTADYAGNNYFGLELVAGLQIEARQGLCGNWSGWSKIVTVQKVPSPPPPPKVKEPLYACGNHVPIENRIDGALVKVFVEVPSKERIPGRGPRPRPRIPQTILIGKAKLSWVPVFPHLLEGQTIIATQTIGKSESKPSKAVVVKAVPDLPTPTWSADEILHPKKLAFNGIDACASNATFDNLLPGAQVNVFWENLLIGSAEAADTSAIVPIPVKLQSLAEIHANQSLCAKKSNDSDKLTAMGMLAIDWQKITGNSGLPSTQPGWGSLKGAMFGNKVHVPVVTKCPVFEDIKVKLSAPAGIVTPVGSDEIIIPKAKSRGEFVVEATGVGLAWLEADASAKGYEPTPVTWAIGKDSRVPLQVTGTIRFSQSNITLNNVGDTADLDITTNPVPTGGKLDLVVLGGGNPPFKFPKQVTIPLSGKGKATIQALFAGVAWIDVDQSLASNNAWTDADHPGSGLPRCKVTVVTPPPPQQPYQQVLSWGVDSSGTVEIVSSGPIYLAYPQTLVNVKNSNTQQYYNWDLEFPNGKMLAAGADSPPGPLGLPNTVQPGFVISAIPHPHPDTVIPSDPTVPKAPLYVALTFS